MLCWLLTLLMPQESVTPTFTKDVAPLLFRHCTSCHRTGEVAPFPLISYTDVKKRTKLIGELVAARRMPPWKPEPGHGDFVGERRMTDGEIALLERWLDEGAIEGDPNDLPALPQYPAGWLSAWPSGTDLGEPDLVVKMAEPFTVAAEGRDTYRAFVIPLGLSEDKFVRAVAFRAQNPRVVHHALLYLDVTGAARERDAQDAEAGFGGPALDPVALYRGGLGGWTPGAFSQPYPDGIAKEVKQGSDLVVRLHFSPTGKPEIEQSQVGIWFAKERPKRLVSMVPLANRNVDLAPGDSHAQVVDSWVVPVDVDLIGIIPHAHYLGRECEISAKTPDGSVVPLIWIRDWDFDWQEQYRYRSIVRIPKGSVLSMVWTYDNSAGNPRNPSNPPKRVRFGEQTESEMAMALLQLAPVDEADADLLMKSVLAKRQRQ